MKPPTWWQMETPAQTLGLEGKGTGRSKNAAPRIWGSALPELLKHSRVCRLLSLKPVSSV